MRRLRGVILEGEEIEGGSYWASEEIECVILEGEEIEEVILGR